MKYLLALSLLLGSLAGVGCQSLPIEETVRSAGDHELALTVHRELRDQMKGNSNLIGVTATDGVVTLHGTVNDRAVQAHAVSIAEQIPGVSQVVNRLGL